EDAFPNPHILDATRAPWERCLPEDGCFKVLGDELVSTMVAEVLRAVLSLENVRRGPGQSGKLARFSDAAEPMADF
ncbi:hypothetical protein DFJ58DRAFT_638405, partial [Suillus subalutaceus]|uniref:uncharacterized protein n=1 Tax=Suillus subalutaceus TaxID=48586 RepID=UPI001B877C32